MSLLYNFTMSETDRSSEDDPEVRQIDALLVLYLEIGAVNLRETKTVIDGDVSEETLALFEALESTEHRTREAIGSALEKADLNFHDERYKLIRLATALKFLELKIISDDQYITAFENAIERFTGLARGQR
jgi:hypothetical protein